VKRKLKEETRKSRK